MRRQRSLRPPPTSRLQFRETTDSDLDEMAALLGDPEVMRHYPRPRTRAEAQAWIDWNRRNYAEHGYGLWIVETRDGEFVGDCGLTWQEVNGAQLLEIGYHVTRPQQGNGYATEAAGACFDLARQEELGSVIAIIDPGNTASQRVATKLGMILHRTTSKGGRPVLIYGIPPESTA